jgi:hypothetical protein
MKKFFLFIFVSSLLFIPFTVSRAQLGTSIQNLDSAVGGDTGLQKDLATNIGAVVKGILSLVGTIFLLLTVYAGILWMTAQGEEAKVGKAIQIIRASIIGLVITLSAYAITYFVTTKLGGASKSQTPGGNPVPNCQPPIGTCVDGNKEGVEFYPYGQYYCPNKGDACAKPKKI